MADTVREKILANLKTTLEGLTTGNGYNFDFTAATVQRWSMHGNSTTELPMILVSPGDQSQKPFTNALSQCDMEVLLPAFYKHEPTDSVVTDKRMNQLEGDIKKIVMVDETRGGNALSTQVTGSSPFESEEDQRYAGIVIELLIKYRHLTSDPETAG